MDALYPYSIVSVVQNRLCDKFPADLLVFHTTCQRVFEVRISGCDHHEHRRIYRCISTWPWFVSPRPALDACSVSRRLFPFECNNHIIALLIALPKGLQHRFCCQRCKLNLVCTAGNMYDRVARKFSARNCTAAALLAVLQQDINIRFSCVWQMRPVRTDWQQII